MTKSIPSEKEVKEKYAAIKSRTRIKKLKKADVDKAAMDLAELVQGATVGITDNTMLSVLGSYNHSREAIRAAEQRLVNNKMIIGKIVPKSKHSDWRDGEKRYFWNNNYQGEKNGK